MVKNCLCYIGRHKLMQCDVVTLVKGGQSRANRLVKLLRKYIQTPHGTVLY